MQMLYFTIISLYLSIYINAAHSYLRKTYTKGSYVFTNWTVFVNMGNYEDTVL